MGGNMSRGIRLFGIIILCLLTSSCSYFFGNDQDEASKNSFDFTIDEKSSVNCVKDNDVLFSDYFDMKRDDAQMRADMLAMKSCMNEAIDLVILRTRGDISPDMYSANELYLILTSAFEKSDMTLDLVKKAFRIKESLIGGSADVISKKDEAQKIKAYMNFVYEKLAYHASDRHYLFSEKHSDNHAEFLAASARFKETVREFLLLPLKTEGTFDYLSLPQFVDEFMKDDKENNKTWQNTFKIVNALQSFLSAGQKDFLDIKKFPMVMESLGDVFLSYMEFQKFLRTELVEGEPGYDDAFYKDVSTTFTFPGLLSALVKDPNVFLDGKLDIFHHVQLGFIQMLRKGLEEAPDQKLSLSYVDDLIDTFEEIEAMPSYTQAATLKAMAPQFFGRWLSSRKCEGPACYASEVTLENVDHLKKLIVEWKERQEWVNTWVTKNPREQVNVGNKPQAQLNLQYFQDSVNAMKYLHWEDYVIIGSKEINYKDLLIFNKIYTLVTMFTGPLNNNTADNHPLNSYITAQQTDDLFNWFRELGVELRVLDPRSGGSSAAFLEINLFMPSSKNPTQLDFIEMLDYLEISISTALRSVHLVEDELIPCHQSVLDVFELNKLEATCVRPQLKTLFENHFLPSLPEFKKYLDASASRFPATLEYLEKSARQGMITDRPMETDNFRMMSSISMYAESLYLRFDKDGNRSLNGEELTALLNDVRPVIRKLLEDNLEQGALDMISCCFPGFEDALLTFMAQNKEIPLVLTMETDPGALDAWPLATHALGSWAGGGFTWLMGDNTDIRREDILFVINGLSTFNKTNRIKALRKIFDANAATFQAGLQLTSPVLLEITPHLQCSSKIHGQIHQWLIDHRGLYWSKYNRDNENWTQDVTYTLIRQLEMDQSLSPLCGLPFIGAQ